MVVVISRKTSVLGSPPLTVLNKALVPLGDLQKNLQ
jgi:hypothetical protein